jgi:hypothetical protein
MSEPAYFTSEESAAYRLLIETADAIPRHQPSPWRWVQRCQEGPPHVVAAALMHLARPTTAARHEAMRYAAQGSDCGPIHGRERHHGGATRCNHPMLAG